METARPVLIVGSAPNAVAARELEKTDFSAIVAVNNAWRIRPDWDYLIFPDDFSSDRMPPSICDGQRFVTSHEYVPANNAHGGIVYAGGTMAFTAGYWALAALRPTVLAFLGCDMVYARSGATHFYGSGQADPLRHDPTLRNLEAKSARLMLLAARQGCACVRLTEGESRLVFPVVGSGDLDNAGPVSFADDRLSAPLQAEASLGYMVSSGRYWDQQHRFDTDRIDAIDSLWQAAHHELTATGRVAAARVA